MICFNCKTKETKTWHKTSFGSVCDNCIDIFKNISKKYHKRINLTCKKCHHKSHVYSRGIDIWNYVCDKCKEKEKIQCDCCGKRFDDILIYKNIIIYGKQQNVCTNCFRFNVIKCDFCGKYVLNNNFYFNYYVITDINNLEKEKTCCKDCSNKISFTCKKCHEKFIKNDNNYGGNDLCSECSHKSNVNDYCFKPDPVFHGDKQNDHDFFIGIELEIEGNNKEKFWNFLEQMNSFKDFIYMKEDGSLDANGVEIVSHPATLYFHKNSNNWNKIFELINHYEMIKNENAGLHFHVEKTALTKYMYKQINPLFVIDYFVNNNEDFISQISGRKFNYYCEKRERKNNNWGAKSKYSEHYNSINLGNKSTVEFRFCKSTTDYNDFMFKLNFIYDLVVFSRTITITEVLTSSFNGLDLFVNMFGDKYKNLNIIYNKES